MTKSFSMRWVIALKAEAKEIIKQYDLISFDHEGPFPVYKNKSQDIWLTISGIGQINSSAATIHLFHKSNLTLCNFPLKKQSQYYQKNHKLNLDLYNQNS